MMPCPATCAVLLAGACLCLLYGLAWLWSNGRVYSKMQRFSTSLSRRIYQLLRVKQVEGLKYSGLSPWSPVLWPKGLSALYLCVMASSAYTFMLTCSTVIGAYQCSRWPAPTTPLLGEHDLGSKLLWRQDSDVVCFKHEHLLLAVVATLIGLPGMVVYLLLLGVACYSCIKTALNQQDALDNQSLGKANTVLPIMAASPSGPAGLVHHVPMRPPIEEVAEDVPSSSSSHTLPNLVPEQGFTSPLDGRQNMLAFGGMPPRQPAAGLDGFLSRLPWALVVSGQPWGTCWWLPLRELAKVLVGIGLGALGGMSPFPQVVYTMGAMGTTVLMQSLVQPWHYNWVRQGAELAYGALLVVGVLMTGMMVAVVAGGSLAGVVAGLGGGVVAVVGVVTLFWIWRLANVRSLYGELKLRQH